MDWSSLGAQAILALVPVVTVLVVSGIRAVVPKIPRFLLPILATALPFALTLLTNYIGGHTFSPALAALLGASATWLREIVSTLQEHGTSA